MCSNYSPSEQEIKKLEERIEKNENDMKATASSYALEKERMEAVAVETEREAREGRETVEAKYNQQMADLNRRLQDTVGASTADQTRLEQEVREEIYRAQAELADLNRRLQDATSASAANLTRLEQEVEERTQVKAEHDRQLVDLTRCLQEETNVSVAYRVRLEKELQDCVTTTYVRVFLLGHSS